MKKSIFGVLAGLAIIIGLGGIVQAATVGVSFAGRGPTGCRMTASSNAAPGTLIFGTASYSGCSLLVAEYAESPIICMHTFDTNNGAVGPQHCTQHVELRHADSTSFVERCISGHRIYVDTHMISASGYPSQQSISTLLTCRTI